MRLAALRRCALSSTRKFERFSTSTLSDALDRLGISGQVDGIQPVDRNMRLCGRAFTLLYQPVDITGGTVGDYIDDVPPGSVIAMDNHGRMDATVWGDILTLVGHRRGVAGTVIDGVCRDSARSLEVGYPLFSRGRWMRTGKDRVKLAGADVPITLGHVRVLPGDMIVGDADGVVVIPSDAEEDVAEVAAEIDAAEERIRSSVHLGLRLDEARRQDGYHSLQTLRRRDGDGAYVNVEQQRNI